MYSSTRTLLLGLLLVNQYYSIASPIPSLETVSLKDVTPLLANAIQPLHLQQQSARDELIAEPYSSNSDDSSESLTVTLAMSTSTNDDTTSQDSANNLIQPSPLISRTRIAFGLIGLSAILIVLLVRQHLTSSSSYHHLPAFTLKSRNPSFHETPWSEQDLEHSPSPQSRFSFVSAYFKPSSWRSKLHFSKPSPTPIPRKTSHHREHIQIGGLIFDKLELSPTEEEYEEVLLLPRSTIRKGTTKYGSV